MSNNKSTHWPDRRTQIKGRNQGWRQFILLPSGDQDVIAYVDDADHTKTAGYAVSGSPLAPLANLRIDGGFPPDTILSNGAYEAGGTQSYSGTASYSLVNENGDAILTIELEGNGSSSSSIDTAVPQETPNYYSQSSSCGNIEVTLNDGVTQCNGTQSHAVSGHDAEGGSPFYLGFVSMPDFISLMSLSNLEVSSPQCLQRVQSFQMRP